MPKIANKSQFLNAIKSLANGSNVVSRAQCVEAANSIGLKYPPAWFVQDKSRSAGRGLFHIDTALAKQNTMSNKIPTPVSTPAPTTDRVAAYALASSDGTRTSLIPDVNPDYVPFGHFEDVKKIIESGVFASFYITVFTDWG